MNPNLTRVLIQRDVGRLSNTIIFAGRDPATMQYQVVTNITFETVPEGYFVPNNACLTFDDDVALSMMNDLWRMGFRPSEAIAGDVQIKAINRHLDDMRAIVADALDVTLP